MFLFCCQISCLNRLFSRVIDATVNLPIQPWPRSSSSVLAFPFFHLCVMCPSMMYLFQDTSPSLRSARISFSRLAMEAWAEIVSKQHSRREMEKLTCRCRCCWASEQDTRSELLTIPHVSLPVYVVPRSQWDLEVQSCSIQSVNVSMIHTAYCRFITNSFSVSAVKTKTEALLNAS